MSTASDEYVDVEDSMVELAVSGSPDGTDAGTNDEAIFDS